MQRTTKPYQCHPWRWMLPVFVFLCCDKSLAINIDVAFADVSSDSKIVLVNAKDLTKIDVSVQVGDDYTGYVQIKVAESGRDKIKLWADKEKTQSLLPADTWEWTVQIVNGSLQPVDPVIFWVEGIKESATTDDVVIKATLSNGDVDEVKLTLLPVEVNHVDRDIVLKLWNSNQTINSTDEVYSSDFQGDMIEWRIRGLESSDLNFDWFAEDQDGARITGPSGSGVHYWQISDDADSNDPAEDKWLKLNPGNWKIICRIDGQEHIVSEFKLGWRTRTILVIGQIVPTTTHDPDIPTGTALSAWAEALADDFTYGLDFGGTGTLDQAVLDVTKVAFQNVPTKATEAWMGYWSTGLPTLMPAFVPYVAPPTPPASVGPFTSSLSTSPRGALGAVTANQRYWMIQHLLNVNDDETSISADKKYPQEMVSSEYATAYVEQQYRILHLFRAKFFLDSSDQIDSGTIEVFHHTAKNGPTKLNLNIQEGEFGTTPWIVAPVPIPPLDVPPFSIVASILTESSEASPHNQSLNVASDNSAFSSYASARIGLKGQRGSYRLFGKDAPWIFSEIIFEVGSRREIGIKVGTSVTTEWTETDADSAIDGGGIVGRAASAPTTTPGLCPFNNLNIYDYRPSATDDPTSDYIFSRRGILEMEGQVESFVKSTSGSWPEPPTTPSVK